MGNGGTESLPYWRYSEAGERKENITEWALDQFKKHYLPGRRRKERSITKEAIFHYVYGVLHDPLYREKYAQNLKRELPRIPFYHDFWQWSDWGKALMDLHIGYETVDPWPLKRVDLPDEKARQAGMAPKPMLKADKEASRITLDSETTLAGVPPEAWDYQLGNRSALEWVLDQYKEKKPKDPTIRAKFDTYRFADHKDKVIDLLARVATVSVATVKITREMRAVRRQVPIGPVFARYRTCKHCDGYRGAVETPPQWMTAERRRPVTFCRYYPGRGPRGSVRAWVASRFRRRSAIPAILIDGSRST